MADWDPVKMARAMEVMETVVAEAATVVFAYFASLKKLGFNDEQALTLTNTFQTIWWTVMFRAMGGTRE